MRRHLRMVVIMGIALFTACSPRRSGNRGAAQARRHPGHAGAAEPPTLASYLSTSGPIGQVTAKVYDGCSSTTST